MRNTKTIRGTKKTTALKNSRERRITKEEQNRTNQWLEAIARAFNEL